MASHFPSWSYQKHFLPTSRAHWTTPLIYLTHGVNKRQLDDSLIKVISSHPSVSSPSILHLREQDIPYPQRHSLCPPHSPKSLHRPLLPQSLNTMVSSPISLRARHPIRLPITSTSPPWPSSVTSAFNL